MNLNRILFPVFFFLLLFFLATQGHAQKTIRGTVTDAKTGDTLPSANILVKGTYRGTISNESGRYKLSIPDSLLPAIVTVRFIGYETEKREITEASDELQAFSLVPSVLHLGKITVTDEDPAVGIMREVIRRKHQWRQKLETYKADAYTRQSLSNDTSIVMITESTSTAYWDKQRGHREVMKSRRQTANMASDQNFAGVSYLPNFYDDNIEIAGFELFGVTHPEALTYYDFELTGQSSLNGRVVYEIAVEPGRKLQPLFRGTIWVLDEEYALLEVRLQPNEVVKFPPPIKSFDTYYEQQFNNFGREFWLPVDVRINGDIKISMVGLDFPRIRFRQLSQLNDYRVNIELPDSLYEDESMITVDSTSIASDSLLVQSVETVPLTGEEQQAYQELDSTATLEDAFKPSGFLSRFVDTGDENNNNRRGPGLLGDIPGSFTPALRFNRVDELYAGLTYEVEPVNRLELSGEAGYSTGYGEWNYGAGIRTTLFRHRGFRYRAGINWKASTKTRYQSGIYSPLFTIIPNLMASDNYFDYYRNEGYRLFMELEDSRRHLSLNIQVNREEHRSLSAVSAYDFLGKNNAVQFNPPIKDGRLLSLAVEGGYNLDEENALGVTGIKKIGIRTEHTLDTGSNDFKFSTWSVRTDWNFTTFYSRRLLPNTLDISVTGGTSTGSLPPQKMETVDAALGYFSPFGTLKTIRFRPYEGERYFSVMAEHNFRTIPFELVGAGLPVKRNLGIIVFGGIAKAWIPGSRRQEILNRYRYIPRTTGDGLHIETGISLNGILGLFRVDFAQRLDEPAFLVNVSIARIF